VPTSTTTGADPSLTEPLSPGQHFAFLGYMPQSGEKAAVRFSGYGKTEIVSNEGEGFVSTKDIADARMDVLGRHVSYSIERLLERNQSRGNDPSLSPALQVTALRLLLAAGRNPYYENAARQWAEGWEKNPGATSDEKAGEKAIRELLAELRAERRCFDALFERCIKALNSPEANNELFARIEGNTAMVWGVLNDLATSGEIKGLEKWKPVIDLAIADPTPSNIRGVIGLAAGPQIADEFLPDAFLSSISSMRMT